ncbi:MAG: FIST N-terminal domain-containing protein [Archaeoglobales archaeon]|nr:FIST N-terminal domain-containing protein [Archaeoglobales archaeon]
MLEAELIKPEELNEIEAKSALFLVPDYILAEFKKSFNKIKSKNLFGASFPAILYDGEVYFDRLLALTFDFEVKGFRGCEFPEVDIKDAETLLVFGDGMWSNFDDILEKVYLKLGNKVSYLGGGAGSFLSSTSYLFDKKGFFSKDALFLVLPFKTNFAYDHGWETTGYSFISTKTSGRKIEELDWVEAFETYRRTLMELGVELSKENFFEISKYYPFGVIRMKKHVVRDPIYLEGNSIVCAGKVAQNQILDLLYGEKEKIIEAAKKCCEKIENREIVFDCVSRQIFLEKDFEKEKKLFRGCFGALTIGEVACSKGFAEILNKTVVIGEFYV